MLAFPHDMVAHSDETDIGEIRREHADVRNIGEDGKGPIAAGDLISIALEDMERGCSWSKGRIRQGKGRAAELVNSDDRPQGRFSSSSS